MATPQSNAPTDGPNISRRGIFGLAGGVAAAPLILSQPVASAAPPSSQLPHGDAASASRPTAGAPGGPSAGPEFGTVRAHVGDEVTIVPPTQEQINQYPNSFAWDTSVGGVLTRKVLVGVNRHIDDADADASRAYFTSVDEGDSWQEQTDIPEVVPRIQLRDGTILGFGYYTYTEGDASSVETGLTRTGVTWARSVDEGVSFTSGSGELTSDRPMAVATPAEDDDSGLVRTKVSLHDRAFELTDGTICQPALVTFADSPKLCSVLLATTDQGAHWAVRSVIAEDPTLITAPFSYEGLGEPNVVRLADGSLLAVLRTGSWRPLYSCRSTDDGLTWTTVEMMRAGEAAEHLPGINPKLRLLPNGLLVLMTGRDLIRLYISPDGRGEQWQEPVIVSGDGFESGNGGLEVLAHNRVLVIGDKRSNNRPGHPERDYHIWSRVVSVTRHPLHRMDLSREIAAGTITMTTDLEGQSGRDAHLALTDGLVEHGRRAVAAGRRGRGTVTLDLGRSVRLSQIGFGGAEHEQRCIVATSTDGSTWHQHHRGEVQGPQVGLVEVDAEARWVRIQVQTSRGAATLSEVELHTAAMTFTDDPIGALPHGFTGPETVGIVVDQTQGAVLRLASDDDSDPPAIRHSWGFGRTGVRVELDLRAVAIPRSAVVIQLLGLPTTGLGAEAVGVSVGLRASGALQWWDGSVWNESHPAGTLTPDSWQRLVLECPADRSAPPILTIDGVARELTYATALIWDFRVVKFGLSSSASAGQEILIDNLAVDGR